MLQQLELTSLSRHKLKKKPENTMYNIINGTLRVMYHISKYCYLCGLCPRATKVLIQEKKPICARNREIALNKAAKHNSCHVLYPECTACTVSADCEMLQLS